MSFLTGKTKTVQSIPSDIAGLRKTTAGQLQKGGVEEALTGLAPGQDITPFITLFQQTLAPILAQAKESAGNLTGSSLGNILGATAGRSTSDFILNLLNQRAQRFTQLLSGLTETGVGPPQIYHQPGLLDYAFQGAQAAAPFFAKGNQPNLTFPSGLSPQPVGGPGTTLGGRGGDVYRPPPPGMTI